MRRYLVPVLLLAAGCVREPDPFEFVEPSISVHGVIRASDGEVRLSILSGWGDVGVTGPVTVESGGVTVPLTATQRDSTCYHAYSPPNQEWETSCYAAALPAPVAPGTRWSLRATTTEGEDVSGTTVVPGYPALLQPASRQQISYRSSMEGRPMEVTVQWQTPNAPRVDIDLGVGRAYRAGSLIADAECMSWLREREAAIGQPSGTRLLEIGDVYCGSPTISPVQWDSVVVPVLVTAYDSAYAEFALYGESVTHRRRAAALQGAYGVFGSAATTRREIVIVR